MLFEPTRVLGGTQLSGRLLIPLCRTVQQLPGHLLAPLRLSALKSWHGETTASHFHDSWFAPEVAHEVLTHIHSCMRLYRWCGTLQKVHSFADQGEH